MQNRQFTRELKAEQNEFYTNYVNAIFQELKMPNIQWKSLKDLPITTKAYPFKSPKAENGDEDFNMVFKGVAIGFIFKDSKEKEEVVKILESLQVPYQINKKLNRIEIVSLESFINDRKQFVKAILCDYFKSLPEDLDFSQVYHKISEDLKGGTEQSDIDRFVIFHVNLHFNLPRTEYIQWSNQQFPSEKMSAYFKAPFRAHMTTPSFGEPYSFKIVKQLENDKVLVLSKRDQPSCFISLRSIESYAQFKLNHSASPKAEKINPLLNWFIPNVPGVQKIVTSYSNDIPDSINQFVEQNFDLLFGCCILRFKEFKDLWLELQKEAAIESKHDVTKP